MPETESPGLPPRLGPAIPRLRSAAAEGTVARTAAPADKVACDGPPPVAFSVRFVPQRPERGPEREGEQEREPEPAAAAGGPADMEADEVPPPETVALFEAAVRLHSRRLLAIARAIVNSGNRGGVSAEDVVQQALTNLYQHRDRYDWREPGGLMRRAVVNEALRVLRQPRTTPVADDYPEGESRRGTAAGAAPGAGSFALRGQTAAHPWSPADPMIDQETVQRVRQAIGRLPEHFRAALVLCEYEGMAYTQIAEVLGASVPQVKTWLHRGRRQLAEMLKDFVGAEPKQPKHRQRAEVPPEQGAPPNAKAPSPPRPAGKRPRQGKNDATGDE